jgi:hypothetical protein
MVSGWKSETILPSERLDRAHGVKVVDCINPCISSFDRFFDGTWLVEKEWTSESANLIVKLC